MNKPEALNVTKSCGTRMTNEIVYEWLPQITTNASLLEPNMWVGDDNT